MTLEAQLRESVEQHQCDAEMHGWGHGQGLLPGRRCESTDTKLHPTLNRRLCWVHRHAADNFRRGKPLQFVENAAARAV